MYHKTIIFDMETLKSVSVESKLTCNSQDSTVRVSENVHQ